MSLTLATINPGEPEIFASEQGEGPSAGLPCAFVRLSRCNLACMWCDTAYTWDFTQFDRQTEQVTLTEQEVAERTAALGQNRLVITGGEPLLQAPALARLIELLPQMQIEVETNGTVLPPAALGALIDQYNVSPKLAHSGNLAAVALDPARLAHWASEPKAWFKFVIAQPDDIGEVLKIAETHGIDPARIFLMPEGTHSAVLHQRAKWLRPLAASHGYHFSDRLHIHLYGDTRGT